ncbi:hypothetical protein [Leptospira idonii]|uniref:STAS domain-containing protein n=1 Tax=Leptospira idonii TaxID=1193500 RepID=A0A4R9M2U4_9LEPT|nr:hypothetical protein [Leptospira idonii]TGN19118.1 hypothetical protein EHS15_10470 [Leptospira idonii]
MARKTKYLSIREIENAYEIQVHSKEYTPEVEDEITSVIAMLFFQTRSHIQLDVTSLNSIPQAFLTQILRLAKDLRMKKRVLVLLGVPYSVYFVLQRFQLLSLFFQTKEGMIRKKFHNPLLAKEESQG